jgi:hypothetical protein
MIEFKGEITSKNAIDSQGRMLKKVLIICSIATMLFMLVLLGANSFFRILILTFIPITMIVMVIIPNKYMAFLPERLFVDLDERTIVSQKSGTGETFKMLDDVTKVEDFGD